MKKIIFGLSIIGLVGLTSCQDDFMEFEPSNSSEIGGAIENEAQLETAVLGIYDALQSNFAYGNYYISAQEILSDNDLYCLIILIDSQIFIDLSMPSLQVDLSQICGPSVIERLQEQTSF